MSEPTAEEREQQLVKLRRKMGRVLRRGEMAEYDRLAGAYGRLKGEHAQLVHEEYVAARRAVVAAREDRPVPAPLSEAERWRRAIRGRYGSGPTAIVWRPGR